MARLARILSTALITAAIVLLIDVGITLAYGEPISALYGTLQQRAAAGDLEEVEAAYPAPSDVAAARQAGRIAAARSDRAGRAGRAAQRQAARVLANRFARGVAEGEPIGRILSPKMNDLDAVVLQGTATGTLQQGPGHYPDTAFPGQPGTVAIAGHRTTYLAPFREIAKLGRGDRITLEMPYGRFNYRVEKHEIVTPDRVDVIDDVGYPRLVLSACHPLYSAAERYIIFARLTSFRLRTG